MRRTLKKMLMIGLLGLVAASCSGEKDKEEVMPDNDTKTQGNPVVKVSTSKGDIIIRLAKDKAPVTVENFIGYVKDGHYKKTIFHRVIDGFMVQGGGFTEDMEQKPTKDSIKNEARNGLKNKRGTIAMARTSEVDSASSQFFINLADNEFLDYKGDNPREFGYCVFGEVTNGMDVIDRIKDVKTGSSGYHQNVPLEKIEILDVALIP